MTDEAAFDGFWEHVFRIAQARKETPLSKLSAPWHLQTGCWEVWINGLREKQTVARGVDVAPAHAYVEFNGWPFALMSPMGGTFGAGEAGNLTALVEALAEVEA